MASATITPDQNTVIAEIFIAAPPALCLSGHQRPGPAPQMVAAIGPVSRR